MLNDTSLGPMPHNVIFDDPNKKPFKTFWEEKKMPFKDKFRHLAHPQVVVCKYFQFGPVEISSIRKISQ